MFWGVLAGGIILVASLVGIVWTLWSAKPAGRRIRTRRQAAKLRPIATERARHSKFMPGDIVFYRGLVWGNVTIFQRYETKPYRTALFAGRNGGFFSGVLSEARPPHGRRV